MAIGNFPNVRALLFENKTINQTIFKNTFWLIVGTGISGILKLILLAYVARLLGATEYGKFSFALAFVSLFVVFSNFGLSDIITREFSREKEKEKEFYSIISLKIFLSLGTLVLILVSSLFITPDPLIRKVIWILGIWVVVTDFIDIICAFLRARQKMEYEAIITAFQALALFGMGLFIIFNLPSIENLSYSYLFTSLLALVSALFFLHFKFIPCKISLQKTIWQRFLAMSWPLALAGIFSMICANIDSVMMGYWNQIIQTGWYNAAYKIVNFILIPTGLISSSFYPVLSKFAFFGEVEKAKEQLQDIWDRQMKLMIILALPLAIGGVVLAPKIINFIYGSAYTPSVLAFRILIIMAGIIFLHTPFNQILIASNQQKKFFYVMILGTITNIALNLILIPKFSFYGAAFAILFTHILILFSALAFTAKFTSVNPFDFKFILIFFGALFASLIMYLTITQGTINQLHIIFSVLIGTVVYFASFFAFKKLINQFIKI